MMDPVTAPSYHDTPYAVALEGRIKFFYLIPFLVLRKCPDPAHANPINATIWVRVGLRKLGNLTTLVAVYERGIVFLGAIKKPSVPKSSRAACYCKTVKLIRHVQLKRVCQKILPND